MATVTTAAGNSSGPLDRACAHTRFVARHRWCTSKSTSRSHRSWVVDEHLADDSTHSTYDFVAASHAAL